MPKTKMSVAYGGAITTVREADDNTPTGHGRYTVRIIRPGQGSSGVYTAPNLASSVGVFAEGTQMYMDHPTLSEDYERPERSVRDLAGYLSTDAYVGEDGALYAECIVYPSFDTIIREKWDRIGVSINAWSNSDIGPDGVVPVFDGVTSVDFVTKAGAGGALLDVLESQRENNNQEETVTPEEIKTAVAEAIAEAMPAFSESVREAFAPVNDFIVEARKPADKDEDEDKKEDKKESFDAAVEAAEKIAESDLPDAAKARVREAFIAGTAVEDAIAAERDYLEAAGVRTMHKVEESAGSEAYTVKNFK